VEKGKRKVEVEDGVRKVRKEKYFTKGGGED